MKRTVVFSLLLSLAVLAGCTRSLDTPSSESSQDIPQIEVIESSSQPETSSESASSSEASESSSSSEAESSQPEPSSSLPPVKEPEPTPSSSTAPPPPASTQQPVHPESTLIITFVDSNGVPAAFQEVTYMFDEYLSEISLGKTDANGTVVFHPQAIGEYSFELDYDKNRNRVDPGYGMGIGPVIQYCTVTELGHTEEYTHVIKVYPITENTPTENCIAFTILNQEGEPLKDIRLFYKEATDSDRDYLDMEWLHMGLTNEDGQFFFQYPKAGDYLFMHEHPDRPDRRCHISYTLTSDKGRYDITNIVGPENMY